MILHLLPRSVWHEVSGQDHYVPETYAADGFVHCSGTDEVMLAVANRFYRAEAGELVVLALDEADLDVRWEAAEPSPPPGLPDTTLFPHVYEPLDLGAVVGVRRLLRDEDGTFVGYGPIA
jgi:uncharacterized protein (DUF952 family)